MRNRTKRRIGAAVAIALVCATLVPTSAWAARSSAPDGGAESSWIVTLQSDFPATTQAKSLAAAADGRAGHIFEHALNGFVFKGSARAAANLARNPNVRTVTADGAIHLAADTIPDGLSRIAANSPSAPDAYEAGYRGAGARIAILDTGVDLTHPDLVASLDLGLGLNCMTNPVGSAPPQDGHGHGTHVAGIVAAPVNGVGVVGVAPEARIVPVKVVDDAGNGEWSNVICGIDYVTGLATDANPDNDIDVVNMSLGDVGGVGTCNDGFVREAICDSVAAGVTYVAAAGNSTVDTSTFIPAAMPEVIAVSALTDLDGRPGGLAGCLIPGFDLYCDDTLAEFSNFGPDVELTAPGYEIYSDWTGGGYSTASGTSMASPHVAGVAALVRAENPALSPLDIRDLLLETGECANGALADADGSGDCVGKGEWDHDPDGYGEPVVNALHAASTASTWSPKPTVTITSPPDGTSVSGVVTVLADAEAPIGIAQVSFAVNNVPVFVDLDASDGWSFLWDTSGLDTGRYTVRAEATDTGGQSRTARTTVQVGTNQRGDWVGTFGVDGYIIPGWNGSTDLVDLPAEISYAVDRGARYSWASPTGDLRALENLAQTERRATTLFDASQVRMHLAFASAYTGTLHLYAVDWDSTARRQSITVDDGTEEQSVSLTTSFNGGAWMSVPISVVAGGTVQITVDRAAGGNAVISGVFLGGAGEAPPPPPPPPLEIPGVQGYWVGNYGADGFVIGAWNGTSDLNALPSGVSYGLEQGLRHTWVSLTGDGRALESPDESQRRATTFYDPSQIRLNLTFSTAYIGTLHLYAVDWDSTARRQNVTVDDGAISQALAITTSFNAGAWTHFPIAVVSGGTVVITVDRTAGGNAVLSGLFLGDDAATVPPPPTVPGAPTNLAATPGDGQVALTWSAPASDGGSLITSYTATASPGGATCTTATLGCTVTGLTNGATYSFTVVATNSVGDSAPSSPVSATPGPPPTVPGAPANLAATPGDGQVALTWSAPASDGGSLITSYTATASPGGATCTTATLGCTVTGLANGTSVSFSVVATNAVGSGPASSSVSATPVAPATVPGAPTNLKATSLRSGGIQLTWSAPTSDGGSSIIGYQIYRSTSTGTEVFFVDAGNVTSFVDTSTTSRVRYYYKVTAVNAIGVGALSAEANARAR